MKPTAFSWILASLTVLLFTSYGHAADITATGSGNWSSTVPDAPWPGGIIPGSNDDIDVESPFTVTVDTNETIQYMYGSGAVIMGSGITLNVVGDPAGAEGTYELSDLDATAHGNTIIYSGNPFWASHQNYYNLVFSNTVTTSTLDFYNGYVNTQDPAAAMNIAGNLSVIGKIKVQQGADFNIGGSLVLDTDAQWDCSSFNLTVAGNLTVGTGALLLDLDGALGSNNIEGNFLVASTALGWNISDVTQWAIGGSLTNNGLIVGKGYGSITFYGTGAIAGSKTLTIPTLTINGTSQVGTSIVLTTNTPTLNGTLVFDLARTNGITLPAYVGTDLYYSGNLDVINTGPVPVSGKTYRLFYAPGFGGAFTSESLPALPAGLSWVDNTLVNGSITVAGTANAGSPVLAAIQNGRTLTLSWDAATYPGYSVEAQTNAAGIGNTWTHVANGSVSPYTATLNPSNLPVFYRLSNP